MIEIKSGFEFKKQEKQASENLTKILVVPQYFRAYVEVQELLRRDW